MNAKESLATLNLIAQVHPQVLPANEMDRTAKAVVWASLLDDVAPDTALRIVRDLLRTQTPTGITPGLIRDVANRQWKSPELPRSTPSANATSWVRKWAQERAKAREESVARKTAVERHADLRDRYCAEFGCRRHSGKDPAAVCSFACWNGYVPPATVPGEKHEVVNHSRARKFLVELVEEAQMRSEMVA